MAGMTMKQYHRWMFVEACEAYRTIDPKANPTEFIRLSVAVHALKGQVPKSIWKLAKRS